MHSLPIWEELRELLTAHARPSTHAPDVNMDKVCAWIKPNAALLHAHCSLAYPSWINVRKADVHRPAEHMLAVFRDGSRAAPQGLIGLRRAVGTDDVDGTPPADGAVHLPNDVEEAGSMLVDCSARQSRKK